MTEITHTAAAERSIIQRITSRFTLVHLAFMQALVAMSGSLYFSEIMHFPPCNLCWYQRIAMYPIVAILGVGIWRGDHKVHTYALPLSFIGMGISFYHCAMTYGFVEPGACAVGATSCTIRWINWFGFVTIPLLAFIAFTVISVALVASMNRGSNVEE